MKAIIVCLLSCLSVFAGDINDINVTTWSYKIMPENSLATIEVFTRDGQTNLVRETHTKDGVVLFRNQNFYHNGIEVGSYTYRDIYRIGNPPDVTMVSSSPGSPYYFDIAFDTFNRPLSAQISTFNKPPSAVISGTNFVELDLFRCTNGVFYPANSSVIQKLNAISANSR